MELKRINRAKAKHARNIIIVIITLVPVNYITVARAREPPREWDLNIGRSVVTCECYVSRLPVHTCSFGSSPANIMILITNK